MNRPTLGRFEGRAFQVEGTANAKAWRWRGVVCPVQNTSRSPVGWRTVNKLEGGEGKA